MRISDWSSDVCSSDLSSAGGRAAQPRPMSSRWLPHARSWRSGARPTRSGDALPPKDEATSRSEERRGGKECVSTCRSRWSTEHEKKKQTTKRTERDHETKKDEK